MRGDHAGVSESKFHVCPSFMKPDSTKNNTQVCGAPAPKDMVRQEAHRVCSEWLRSQRPKKWVEHDPELACLWVAGVEGPSSDVSVLANQNILHPLLVRL
jgi:hypothetical protein